MRVTQTPRSSLSSQWSEHYQQDKFTRFHTSRGSIVNVGNTTPP